MSSPFPSGLDRKNHAGFFYKAQNLALNGGQFVEANNVNEMNVTYVKEVIASRIAAFELLEPYTCLEATKDSSARHPPPRCHPGTRLEIRDRLMDWLRDEDPGWKMLWVRGFAGTGKSAVAQSFADSCEKEDILGGSYFFSRTAGRDKLETVVPTLVYQLASIVPEYHSFIESRLAKDRLLLRNSPPVQFRKLIIEPVVAIQRQRSRKPIAIILDGLDECKGEDAQLEILEMIANAVRTNPDLPLRWLIFSRPEAHLRSAFLELTNCGREQLIVDAQYREDVEKYTRERISQIKNKFRRFTPANWPPQDQLKELLDLVSGLFVLASTCLNYIGHPEEADPQSKLNSLLTFMRRSQGVLSRNPLAALDLLYSRILDNISPTVFKTTWRILAYLSRRREFDLLARLDSVQALCNFLHLDQCAFYKAVDGLYSVLSIPEPEEAAKSQLQFHHASFQDFLLDPNRSGKFAIDKQKALVDLILSGIHWYEVDVSHFHSDHGRDLDLNHDHAGLPGLTWVSEDNEIQLSQSVLRFFIYGVLQPFSDMQLDSVDERLLSQLCNVDFRYWYVMDVIHLVQLCQLDSSSSVVRTEPSSPTDHRLLQYLDLMTGNGIIKPAMFYLKKSFPARWAREYFFIGHGMKSAILWVTMSRRGYKTILMLRSDKEPSEGQISEYQEVLQQLEWDEDQAKLEME